MRVNVKGNKARGKSRPKKKYTKKGLSKSARKEVKKIHNKLVHKDQELFHGDWIMTEVPGGYPIRPWGIDNAMGKGTLFEDAAHLPVNIFDNIIQLTEATPPTTSEAARRGNSIFLKSINLQFVVQSPSYTPAQLTGQYPTTLYARLDEKLQARIRVLVIWDPNAKLGLTNTAPYPAVPTGTLEEIYSDVNPPASNRQLPFLKKYIHHRFKVLSQKEYSLNALSSQRRYIKMNIKIDKKVNFEPNTETALQGVYVFIMSDFGEVHETNHPILGPRVTAAKLRYYYRDA